MKKEGLLSITEMARLRGITTETLRHYDRIGLIRPDALDENNVRYYSVLQYEKLETIRELQEIGLSLKEIGAYLAHRDVKASYALLCRQQHYYEEKLREYAAIKEALDQRIGFLSSLPEEGANGALPKDPFLQTIGDRICLCASSKVHDEVSLAYGCMELEKQARARGAFIPTYASDNYIGRFPLSDSPEEAETELLLALSKADKGKEPPTVLLPGGTFLCLWQRGSFWDRTDLKKRLLAAGRAQGLSLTGEVLLLSKIDYSITDDKQERLYEVQARIRKS
ncbi:MAG: MerR family transcriptional regulator [Lachnospiraceae bacterium]